MPPGARIRSWIKLAVAIVLIAVLLSFVDWRQSLHLLGAVQLLPALYAAALLAVGVVLSTLKWQVLLAAHELRLPLLRLLKYYWTGSFFSAFLPSNVGGDVVRLALMHNQGSLTVIGASIVVERFIGFLVLLCLAVVGLWMRSQYFAQAGVLLPLWLSVLSFSGALCVVVLLGGRIATWLGTAAARERLTGPISMGRITLALIRATQALAHYRQRMRALLTSIVISLFFYAGMIFFHYGVIVSIGGKVSLLDVAFITPLIALVSFVPISVNALGVAEGAFVLFFVPAGLSPEEALAAALVRRVLMLGFALVGGAIWLWEQPRLPSAP